MVAKVKQIKKQESKPDPSILMEGTATPYLAIFSEDGVPVMNQLTGIPLGAASTTITLLAISVRAAAL